MGAKTRKSRIFQDSFKPLGVCSLRRITIDSNKESESESIRFNCEADSNEIDESDSDDEKQNDKGFNTARNDNHFQRR
jgi:hypothetical protein